MVEEVEQEFVPIKSLDFYEMSTTEPWNFRRIGKAKCLKYNLNKTGYYQIGFSQVGSRCVHRLVAEQFIENPNPVEYRVVHHIDGNKLNNSIENLEWTSQSRNIRLAKPAVKQVNEYLEEMPDNIIEITEYNDREICDYYFDIDNERILKVKNNGRIKIIKPCSNGEVLLISMTDIHKKRFCVSYNKLIRTMKKIISESEHL